MQDCVKTTKCSPGWLTAKKISLRFFNVEDEKEEIWLYSGMAVFVSLQVKALGEDLAWKVIKLWMETAGRDLNNYQWRVVANAVSQCSLPIFCKLVFAEICRWKSYSKPQDTYLAHSVMDSIFLLFEKVRNGELQPRSRFLICFYSQFVFSGRILNGEK